MKDSIALLNEKIWRPARHAFTGGIEITPYCNFKCVHCYLQDQENESENILTTEEIFEILDKLEKYGVLYLYFTGGEIFTRSDFKEIYLYAKKKGFLIELLTNGSLISEELLTLFEEYPFANISISMYGASEESYFRVTGRRGMFDQVINNIKRLMESGLHVELKFIGVKENKQDFLLVREIAQNLGADFTYSLSLFPTLKGNSTPKEHMISLNEIVEMEAQYPGKMEQYKLLSEIPNDLKNKKDLPLYMCDMAKNNFLIDYKGNLNPCHKCRLEKVNLKTTDFKEGWDSFIDLLKIPFPKESKCRNCDYLLMCSPCIVVNELSTGDPRKVPDSVCQLTKLRIERATERR